jgi:hypothetical protein
LPPDKKQTLTKQWEEYNRLPEQERRKLGSAPRKPSVASGAPQSPTDPTAAAPATTAPPELSPPAIAPVPAANSASQ